MATWLLDLDGVIWLDGIPIPGAAEAASALRHAGHRVVFLTNNSGSVRADHVRALRAIGIEVEPVDVVMSADALSRLVHRGERVLLAAGEGAREALIALGAVLVDEAPAEAVVVGFRRDFDYDRLTLLMRTVVDGARLVGMNDDATYPTPEGLIPGGGALLAAVAYASGATPIVAGKPNSPMVELVRDRFDDLAMMVGDRADTDGVLARRLGCRFGLVLSGVTTAADLPVNPEPDRTSLDLAALVAAELA